MKSFFAASAALAMSLVCLATDVHAQRAPYNSPSLFPIPQNDYRYPSRQTAANYRYQQPEGTGVDTPPADDMNNVAPEALPLDSGPMNSGPMNDVPMPQHGVAPEPIPNPHQYGQNHHHGNHDHHGHGHHGACSTCGGFHAPGACPMSQSYGYGGSYGSGYGAGCSPFASAITAPWNWMNSVIGGGYGAGNVRSGWFGGVNGLVMSRDAENQFAFSYVATPATEHNQLLNNRDAEMDWAGGVEASFGRYFNCGQKAWEVVYWGIYPGLQEYTLTNAGLPGPLDGIHDWNQVTIFDPTVPGPVVAGGWVNNADAHRLRRNYEFHNIELNIINFANAFAGSYECPSRFQHNWGFGVRFFRFDEDLMFSAKEAGSGTTFDNSTNQVDYLTEVENNLIGFQLNGNTTYRMTNRLSMNIGAKFGLYANHINQRQRIYSAGNFAVVNNGPYNGYIWNLASNKDDVAFLGELDLGLTYQISCRWSATIGYRAVAASGVALAGAQVPNDLRGINDALLIDSNGSLILHGGYAGVKFCF